MLFFRLIFSSVVVVVDVVDDDDVVVVDVVVDDVGLVSATSTSMTPMPHTLQTPSK